MQQFFAINITLLIFTNYNMFFIMNVNPMGSDKMVGEVIRYYRQKHRMMLTDIAEITGLSSNYLYDIENNIVQNPPLEILSKIAYTLNISIDMLNECLTKNSIKKIDQEWMYLLNQAIQYGVNKTDLLSLILDKMKKGQA